MRLIFFIVLLLIAVAFPENAPVKPETDSLSYALGMEIGGQLKDIQVKLASFYRGVEDVLGNKSTVLNPQQAREIIQAGLQRIQAKKGDKARQEGELFLEKNKKNKGVVVTASGLQYVVERLGKGPKPKAADKVSVHYRGTLVDGKEFDSSYKRGEPISFPLNGVIPGWTEGLQLMPVGSKYRLFIPSQLGYGERGAGSDIPPNAALIFDVELLDIVKDTVGPAK